MIEAVYWLSAFALAYAFAGYGLLILVAARLARQRPDPTDWAPASVSWIIAAHNEEAVIAGKVRNTLALDAGGAKIDVVVVSDGSTDRTCEKAREADDRRIVVLDGDRMGKAAALSVGMERARGEILVFSDANALLAEGALTAMLRHFADPDVGGVCGQISIGGGRRGGAGIGFAEGLFWRYDQALKRAESRLAGAVSAQGSVYAMRRALVVAPEPGLADDFAISVGAVARGKRLVFEPEALTVETVTDSAADEMRRRVRSAEVSWRSLARFRHLMNPFKHGLYAWQLISHKLMRRLSPFFLIALFASNLALVGETWFFTVSFAGQTLFYGAAIAALASARLRRWKPMAIAAFFVMSHAALLVGFARWLAGRKSVTWTPSREAS